VAVAHGDGEAAGAAGAADTESMMLLTPEVLMSALQPVMAISAMTIKERWASIQSPPFTQVIEEVLQKKRKCRAPRL